MIEKKNEEQKRGTDFKKKKKPLRNWQGKKN